MIWADGINNRIEFGQIPQRITQRVSHFAVGVDDAKEDLVRTPNILGIIDRCRPQTQHLSTGFVDDLLWRRHVADRFALLFAFTVNNPTVSDNAFVRSGVVSYDAAAKAGIEPAAILVAALQINIGRKSQRLAASFENSDAARTRIKPNVKNVGFLAKIGTAAFCAFVTIRQKFMFRPRVPRIGGFLCKDVSNVIDDRRVGHRFVASLTIKNRDRHAPRTLARNAPIGPALEHIYHSACTPFRMPFYCCDLV